MIDLAGKHIFVAGGSRGIGAAAARMAAEAGAKVSVNYVKRADSAEALVGEIRAKGGSAVAIQADISQEGEALRAVEKAVTELGDLDGMVVSAGVYEGGSVETMTTEFWDWMLGVNLRGTFLAVQAAARQFRQNGRGGSVVIYSSTAGQGGSAGFSAYAASKAAQIVFMKSMAVELAPLRVRVNCVAPAWTETDMATEKIDAIGRETVIRGFPLGRIGLPEDVAGATCYLLSDIANFVTGITLTVDGGMGMRG